MDDGMARYRKERAKTKSHSFYFGALADAQRPAGHSQRTSADDVRHGRIPRRALTTAVSGARKSGVGRGNPNRTSIEDTDSWRHQVGLRPCSLGRPATYV